MRHFAYSNRRRRSPWLRGWRWPLLITCSFLFVVFIIYLLLPSADHQHPSDHPKVNQNTAQSSTNNEAFLSQFLHHPLPYYTIRNITSYGITRLVAIGDLHGDLSQALKILSLTRCIDSQTQSWIAKDTVLVQTGDIVDRGDESIEIYKLFLKLRGEAIHHNSLVLNILGNHETMDILKEYRYTSPTEIEKHGGTEGWTQLWSLNNLEIGYWLRNAPAILIVGNTVFCHAGLRSTTLRVFDDSIENINQYVRLWLTEDEQYDTLDPERKEMMTGMHGPFWTRAFDPRNYITQKDLLQELEDEYTDKVVDLGMNDDSVMNKAMKPLIDNFMCSHLRATFEILWVKRMVKGHDPQPKGKIADLCDGGLFIIDVGLSAMYGGHTAAIEIDLLRDEVHVIREHKIR